MLTRVDVSYTKLSDLSSIPHLAHLVDLNISGTHVESIASLKACRCLSRLVMMHMMPDIFDIQPENVAAFGLDALSECGSLTHLNMDCFVSGLIEEVIDIRPLLSEEFMAQLTTLMVGANTFGNRCPLRWLSMASIAYILAHAVNVRRLDISHQIVGNMEPDSLKNLTRLEHLSLYGYGEWNKTFDDLGNVPPVLPRLAPCPNLRVLDIGSFFGDSLGDIGACPRLERLHLELDEDEEAHRSIIATMPKHVGRLVSPNARTIT